MENWKRRAHEIMEADGVPDTISNWQNECGCAGLGGATLYPCRSHDRPHSVAEVQAMRQQQLGRNVERMMDARRMSYASAAAAFGLRAKSAVAKIIHGEVDVSASTLWGIADFFGVTINDLYSSNLPDLETRLTRLVAQANAVTEERDRLLPNHAMPCPKCTDTMEPQLVCEHCGHREAIPA